MGRLVRKQVYLTEAERLRLRPATHRPSVVDPLWKIVGLGRSGVRDVSENVDHYLYGAPKR